jgi:hypothetical protein
MRGRNPALIGRYFPADRSPKLHYHAVLDILGIFVRESSRTGRQSCDAALGRNQGSL